MSPQDPRRDALRWLALYRDLGVAEIRRPSASQKPAPSEVPQAGVGAARAAPAGRPAASRPPADGRGRTPAEPRPEAARPPPAAALFDAVDMSPDAPRIAEVLETPEAAEALRRLREDVIGACRRCRLCEGRTTIVFGVGDPAARLLFVGEGPGADEDRQGEPFVGRAGQLLDRIITAMGLARPEVYIGNIVKCRPPENRAPLPDEAATCMPFLAAQIAIIKPKVIVALGKVALEVLTHHEVPGITRVRGQWFDYRGIPVKATFHPAYLLRNPDAKRPVWDDMLDVLARLGLAPPARGGGRPA